jgi:hypothetical protein
VRNRIVGFLVLGVLLLGSAPQAFAMDYLRHKHGQIIQGAIIRLDSAAVFVTDWEFRNLRQPPFQVYTRDEIQSIWFDKPTIDTIAHHPYRPHTNGYEFGGSVAFQTWAESNQPRRNMFQASLHGGYTILSYLGLELDLTFTNPFKSKSDTAWKNFDVATQAAMNVVVHPFAWKVTPYAFVGGGASAGVPVGDILLTSANDTKSLVDGGLGIKWGSNGLGFKAEWRHSYYIWTPDQLGFVEINGERISYRVPEQNADASVFKVGLFFYR